MAAKKKTKEEEVYDQYRFIFTEISKNKTYEQAEGKSGIMRWNTLYTIITKTHNYVKLSKIAFIPSAETSLIVMANTLNSQLISTSNPRKRTFIVKDLEFIRQANKNLGNEYTKQTLCLYSRVRCVVRTDSI